MKSWTHACDDSQLHHSCRSNVLPQLPTRVLDVRNLAQTERVHLLITQGQCADYVALSYCWTSQSTPDTPPLTTKRNNIASMVKWIDIEDLTPSQRICLQLAQKLGIDFVWIDGLCIVQGTYQDSQ